MFVLMKSWNGNQQDWYEQYSQRRLTSLSLVYANLRPIPWWPQEGDKKKSAAMILNTHNLWWFRKEMENDSIHDKFVGNVLAFKMSFWYSADVLALHNSAKSIFHRYINIEGSDRRNTRQAGVKKGVKCQSSVRRNKKSLPPTNVLGKMSKRHLHMMPEIWSWWKAAAMDRRNCCKKDL